MVDTASAADEGAPQSVGELLRAARESRGESIAEAAQALKLTQRQVEAMESGRLDLLPGAAFARGFLRNYARHVGIDPATVMVAVERPAAAPAVELAPMSNAEGVMPAGEGRRKILPAAAVAVVLLILMLAGWYLGWFEPREGVTPVAGLTPPPAADLDAAPAAEPVSPPAAAGGEATPTPPAPPTAQGAAPAAPVVPAQPAAPAGPGGAPGPAAPAAAAPAPAAPAEAGAAAAGEATAPAAATAGAGRLQFQFQGDSWVEVRDGRGRVLHSGLNHAGSSRTVQGEPPFAVVVGNAGQVRLDYDGAAVDLAPHLRGNVARLSLK